MASTLNVVYAKNQQVLTLSFIPAFAVLFKNLYALNLSNILDRPFELSVTSLIQQRIYIMMDNKLKVQ